MCSCFGGRPVLIVLSLQCYILLFYALVLGSIQPLLNVSSTLSAAQTLVSSSIPDPGCESAEAVQAGAQNLYQAAENIALALSSR